MEQGYLCSHVSTAHIKRVAAVCQACWVPQGALSTHLSESPIRHSVHHQSQLCHTNQSKCTRKSYSKGVITILGDILSASVFIEIRVTTVGCVHVTAWWKSNWSVVLVVWYTERLWIILPYMYLLYFAIQLLTVRCRHCKTTKSNLAMLPLRDEIDIGKCVSWYCN